MHVDGVDNLAHWTEKAPSARRVVYYYNESQLTAVRIGNWKSHMSTREGFFDYNRPAALLFNLRMDPFERHDGRVNEHLAMRQGMAYGGRGEVAAVRSRTCAWLRPRSAPRRRHPRPESCR